MLAALATIAFAASSAWARDFGWVRHDPLELSTNPAFLQSSVAITPEGEPVRARLIESRQIHSLLYLGRFQLDQYDVGGNVVWSQTLEGKVHVEDLIVDSAGAIVLHGSYKDTLSFGQHELLDASGDLRAFVLKLRPDRSVEWLFDPGVIEPNLYGVTALAVDAQDRVWIGLTLWSNGSIIRRLEADGTTAEDYVQDDVIGLSGLSVDPDGTVWACGATSSGVQSFNGTDETGPFTYSMYLVKYAPDGMAAWVQFVEDHTFQFPRLASDGSGSVYFSSNMFDGFAVGDWVPEGPEWVYDFFLAKFDTDGHVLWLHEVLENGVVGDAGTGRARFLFCPDEESVYFSGFSRLSVDWGGGETPPSYGGQDVLALEYAADGMFLWTKTAGSIGLDIANAVAADADGNVYIAGSVGENSEFGDQEFTGSFTNTYLASLPAEDPTSVGETRSPEEISLRVGPNPLRLGDHAGDASLRFRLPHAGPVRVELFDLEGARVATLFQGEMARREQVVDWNGRDANGRAVPSGVYLYRIATREGALTSRLTVLR